MNNLVSLGISFNPVYTLRQQFKNDGLIRGGVLDLKSAAETKQNMQFNGIADIGEFLTKTTRNQQIQSTDWEVLVYNGRRLTWQTLFKPILIDKEWEITQAALNDPQSPLSQMLTARVKKTIYKTCLAAAIGPVLTGTPQSTGTSITAAADGVIVVDGTGGWTRDLFQEIVENLYAQQYHESDIQKAFAFISPSMNTAYLALDSVMNRLYNTFNESAIMTRKLLDAINVEVVPGGSAEVNWTAGTEVLPVSGTTRSGVLLMQDALAAVVEDMELFVSDNPVINGNYVDSRALVARFRVGCMRKLGQRVMQLDETLPY